MLEPAAEQFTGPEAHARVIAMLDETMDRVLWRALRVEQHTALGQADLAGQDALTRALDRVADPAGPTALAAPDGTATPGDDGLVERAETELRRYLTSQGRTTGELRAAEVRLAAAREEHERCGDALDAVERDVAARERLDADAAALRARRRAHGAEVAALEDRWAALQSRLREVEAAAEQAALARERAAAAHDRRAARDRLIADLGADARRAGEADARLAEHEAAHAAARTERDARLAADTAARELASAARGAAREAESALADAHDRAELADLDERLRRVEAASTGLAAATGVLDAATVDEDALERLEELARDVIRAEAARDAAAARVELDVPAEGQALALEVDGDTRTLEPGSSHTLPLAGPLAVTVPGVLGLRVRPGQDDHGRVDAVRDAVRVLAQECAALGAADLDAARASRRAALDAARSAGEHRAVIDRELAGRTIDEVRTERDGLRARLGEAGDTVPAPAVLRGVALEARRTAEDAAAHAEDTDRARREADDAVREAETHAAVLAERAADARHDHERRAAELAAAREGETDDAVRAAETERLTRAREAERGHESLAAALAEDDPGTVEVRVVNARAVDDRFAAEAARLEREHAETTGRLQAAGHQGWHDQLVAAAGELADAQRDHDATVRRAAAAARLHETLARHRDAVRRSYVAPFRRQVERLARIVFGPGLALEIDPTLRITHRTLDGVTVAFEALSSGAQEQLGLCARLACAALVDPADGVPVVIDDALGHSDPERLARLGAVFTAATAGGAAGQVVVLTCTPERYHGVGAATVVALAPSKAPVERARPGRAPDAATGHDHRGALGASTDVGEQYPVVLPRERAG